MSTDSSSWRKLRSVCGLRLHRWRARHHCHVISRRDGASRFALIGATHATVAFSRNYLGVERLADVAVTSTFWPLGKEAFARRAVRELGLVVFAPGAEPAALRPDLLRLEADVDVAIALPSSIQAFIASLGNSARSDLSKTRLRGYRPEYLRDPAWARTFLDLYHLPAILGRHGDDGYCSSVLELEKLLAGKTVEWVRVLDGDTCVAACIGERRADDYFLHRLGWLGGCPALLSAGVVGALYEFALLRAITLGSPRLHLGSVWPDLQNGVLAYKSKWGARLLPSEKRFETRGLLLDPAHPDARRFLASHSLLTRAADGRFNVLSARLPEEVATTRSQSAALSGWFRLRDAAASSSPERANEPLPVHLRAWFDAIPLTAFPASAT